MPAMSAVSHPVRDPLQFNFCGLDFGSPLVLLSGCVGFGEEYTRIEGFSNRDAGAIVLKGTTLNPRLGNPPHRVYETPAGMLNAIGLQNPGRRPCCAADPSRARLHRDALHRQCLRLHDRGVRRGHAPLRSVADRCHRNQHLVSQRQGRRRRLRQLSRHVGPGGAGLPPRDRASRSSPSCRPTRPTSARTRAVASRPARMRSRSSTRSWAWRSTSQSRRPVIGNIQGGLSGPAIKPIALLKVHQVYEVARRTSRADHRAGRDYDGDGCAGVHDRRRVRCRYRHLVVLRPHGVPETQYRDCANFCRPTARQRRGAGGYVEDRQGSRRLAGPLNHARFALRGQPTLCGHPALDSHWPTLDRSPVHLRTPAPVAASTHPYQGRLSLDPSGDTEQTHTIGLVFRLGGRPIGPRLYLDTEKFMGAGVSGSVGLGGLTNGDVVT